MKLANAPLSEMNGTAGKDAPFFLTGPPPSTIDQHLGSVFAIRPMSKPQEALWFDYKINPEATHYQLVMRITIDPSQRDGDLFGRIFWVIRSLVRRHGILRSLFYDDPKTLKCFVKEFSPDDNIPSIQVYPTALPQQDLTKLIRVPFKLEKEFPVRFLISHDPDASTVRSTAIYIVGHHIALDGISFSLLSREFWAFLESDHPSLPTLPYNYGNFIEFERAYENSPDCAKHEAFWISQIQHTKLIRWKQDPYPKLQPSEGGNERGCQLWMDIQPETLKNLSDKYRTTWFRVVTALIGVLVASISEGRSDNNLYVAFGGRPKGFSDVMGHFANTMPIRIPIAGRHALLFSDLVRDVSKNLSVAKKGEVYPYLDLARRARSMNQELREQVFITFSPKLANSGSVLSAVEGEYDLFFCFLEMQNSVNLQMIYDPKLFSAKRMSELKEIFINLFDTVAKYPDFDVFQFPGLQPRQSVVCPHPRDVEAVVQGRVHRWISEQARLSPQSLALYSAELQRSITYGELDRRSNQIAHYLKSLGVAEQSVVAIMKRGMEVIEWILGVLKASCVFLVIDPSYPNERQLYMLQDSSASTLVLDSVDDDARMHALIADFGGKVIQVTKENSLISSENAKESPVENTLPTDLAYVIYTSGSTGKPKGVMLPHQGLSNFVCAYGNLLKLDCESRVLQFSPFSFDVSILDWSIALTSGATLCFAEYPEIMIGDYLVDVINKNQINFMAITPSALATVPLESRLQSLKSIGLGGEPCSEGLMEAWRKKVRVLHNYGPTEFTVFTIIFNEPTDDVELPASSASLIGEPLENTGVDICDPETLAVVPTGTIGEICLSGLNMARGYINRTELTEQKFVEHPELGYRIYRTGDRGRILPDGNVQILGRMDRQVKVRGKRVELGEIETVIASTCSEVTLVSVQFDLANNGLVAFVVPKEVDPETIKSKLEQTLPAYMVPTSIHPMESLPLSKSGKLDHNEVKRMMENGTLLQPSHQGKLVRNKQEENRESVPNGRTRPIKTATQRHQPVTPIAQKTHARVMPIEHSSHNDDISSHIQRKLSDIWRSVLSLETDPDFNISFFDLGGHSLILVKLHHEIKQAFPSVAVSIVMLFQESTIEKQASLIEQKLKLNGVNDYQYNALLSSPPKKVLPPAYVTENGDHRNHEVESKLNGQRGLLQDVAIVGMAGKFPGADSIAEYWDLILNGRSGIHTFSAEELKAKSLHIPDLKPEEIFVPKRGILRETKKSDSSLPKIALTEAASTDPQLRLFLEVGAQALIDAGVNPSNTDDTIGLFLGASESVYRTSNPEEPGFDINLANRVAYHLNLRGPSITHNSACSSSLVALKLACDNIISGDCDIALVGGVNVSPPQGGYVKKPGDYFSPEGECRSFDHRASGTIPGDAVAAIVLKRYDNAERDGDMIHGVIKGVVMRNDGAVGKSGYSAPSAKGQTTTIKAALNKAGIPPSHLAFIETHGSGTALGDAVEMEALKNLFEDVPDDGQGHRQCLVGSVKSNIGNTTAAGGLCGLIKAVLAIQHGIIPPQATGMFESLHPMIELNGIPLMVSTKVLTYQEFAEQNNPELPFYAGVTSLGLGGTNAHCIVGPAPRNSQSPNVFARLPKNGVYKNTSLHANSPIQEINGKNAKSTNGNGVLCR
ncbi:uncharacterized protein VTP21DRAFT_7377 [Calcarisporiella thermophila]|uniref:uncharacterized protein n=1 Tax=Calcarisporiella thermophila TaxID=911321 RepID=UPI0037438312